MGSLCDGGRQSWSRNVERGIDRYDGRVLILARESLDQAFLENGFALSDVDLTALLRWCRRIFADMISPVHEV